MRSGRSCSGAGGSGGLRSHGRSRRCAFGACILRDRASDRAGRRGADRLIRSPKAPSLRRHPTRPSGGARVLTVCIDELVERQIHHVVRALAVDEHLRRMRIDLLHCVQIHALTNHCRRLRIFCVDLLEALGIALRLRNDPVAIALRFVDHARRVGLRARQQLIGVGFRGVDRAFVVLAHLRGIFERRLNLRRHLHALDGHARHLQAGLVNIERCLDGVDKLRAQCFAILEKQVVGAVRARDLANRGLRRFRHVLIRIDIAEQIVGRRLDLILHGKAHVDDIRVVRQQRCVAHVGLRHGVVAADFDRTDLRRIDDLVRLERIRQTPVNARIRRLFILAEARHDAHIAVLHDEYAAAQIDRDQHADNNAHADLGAAAVVGTRTAACRLLAEQARELLVEVAPHFVEIRRAFAILVLRWALWILRTLRVLAFSVAIAVAPPPARVVDRKDGMRKLPVTPLVVVVHSVIHH